MRKFGELTKFGGVCLQSLWMDREKSCLAELSTTGEWS